MHLTVDLMPDLDTELDTYIENVCPKLECSYVIRFVFQNYFAMILKRTKNIQFTICVASFFIVNLITDSLFHVNYFH